MNFQPELAELVMAGRKTVTRRLMSDNPRSPWWKGGCGLKQGRTYAVCPGRGKHAIGRVRVTQVTRERLRGSFGETLGEPGGPAMDEEARREGFESAVAFKLAWLKINGSYDAMAWVWRVEMEVVRP